ncbi:MAG TPA: HlyD family efflux transporter periplasmic adaptor subunit [Thermoanaerobaculia bacterium]|nr:HlyD family efflux transporter periplasmic adaptor subunit [Thermoanaerobaculia bacterium]
MDIIREDVADKKRKKRLIIAAGSGAVILLITLGLSRLKPAAPTVDKSTVWTDTVKRGPMLRQVRGPGTLVPEEIRYISAATDGRIERLVRLPGSTPVQPDTILLEMSNPVLERDALDAESQLRAVQAELVNVRAQADRQIMDQQATAATVRSDFHQAELQAATNEGLYKEGLIADLTVKLSRVRAEELATRNAIEEKRVKSVADAAEAQVAVQEAHVEQLKALAALKRSQKDALHVRAGISGVLQELPVQVGQQVAPGTTLAKVADPKRLKAQLKIAETQAKDVVIGQPASIDTRNGVVAGKVSRIDPAVQNGTVTVDVALEGDLPLGARPDLSVDGTVELDRLKDVLFVGRPAFGQEKGQVGLFRLNEDGDEATRVTVKLGKSSVNTVEILEGLKPGDKVILSDMSAWDAYDRVRLK